MKSKLLFGGIALLLLVGLVTYFSGFMACQERSSPNQGLIPLGGDCSQGGQCDIGLVCAHDGTCQDPGTGIIGTSQAGGTCDKTDDCGYGLVCGPDGKCIPGGIADRGDGCGSTEDCRYGLICNSIFRCDEPGTGSLGHDCIGAEECLGDLVCAGDGTCQEPEGVGGPGDPCEETVDCRMGMVCFLTGTCQPPEFWRGVDCSQSEDDENDPDVPFKVWFEVPRGEQVTEFYRLPFPNNIRIRNGHVDLTGHEAPATPLGGGFIRMYLDAIEDEMTGFSPQGAIYVRFSKSPDFDSIHLSGDNRNFYIVDITPESDGYGNGWSFGMFVTTGRGKYICQNWMALKPADGSPLRHATTYAVIVMDTITAAGSGAGVQRDDDFDAVMSGSEPSDPNLRQAWQDYAPLRDYFADPEVDDYNQQDYVVAATVFTTMDPDALMENFRDKISDDCSGAGCDMLPDPGPIGMSLEDQNDDYYEISGTVKVPVFQKGTAPYLTAGGGVDLDGSNIPIIQRNENVNFTLSVPKGTPPDSGWPTVIYAHGTGGSHTSFIGNDVAATLASVDVTVDSTPMTVKFAVLGIDAVQHGTRKAGSELESDVLYFNFMNPPAAKYNAVQGAADNFQLVRMIQGMSTVPEPVSGVADDVKLDPAQIYYFGHSQGCLTGPLFLPFSPDINATVLSGAGGNLIKSLLTKTMPVDIKGATKLVLSDTNVDSLHPMLNLLQLYFDPVDVVNYGRGITKSPPIIGYTEDDPPTPIYAGPKHVFMSFGRDDHYSTEETMMSFARSMEVHQVNDLGLSCTCHSDCDSEDGDGLHSSLCVLGGLTETTTPVRANQSFAGIEFTSVLKMYVPGDYDGHFVITRHDDGPADYSGFLASGVADAEGIPTLLP